MHNRLSFDKFNQAILLFNSSRLCWEDKTESITAIYDAYYYRKHTGYTIYFKGDSGKFFYKNENVKILSKTKSVDFRNLDVYVEEHWVMARQVDAFEGGYFRV